MVTSRHQTESSRKPECAQEINKLLKTLPLTKSVDLKQPAPEKTDLLYEFVCAKVNKH